MKLKWLSISVIGLVFMFPSIGYAYCGDGVKQDIEQCDDGNFYGGDGCDAYCKIEDQEPPTIKSSSIENGAENISVQTSSITLEFSEPVRKEDINDLNITIQYDGKDLDYELSLDESETIVTIKVLQKLFPTGYHAIKIRNVRDKFGNPISGKNLGGFYVITFKTETPDDITPPNVVVEPEEGTFSFPQQVIIKAYKGDYTKSDDFLDKGSVIHYTLNDNEISDNSPVYEKPIRIEKGTTLRYFAIDSEGNRTEIKTKRYRFQCPEIENAEEVINKYPQCELVSCKNGFIPKGNSCVIRLGNEEEGDYKTNAATAPLLPSNKPMFITTRPAIYITPEHEGVIKRPLTFQDPKRGTIIEFEKDTRILDAEGNPFSGYIKPPENLYTKDYPINFGYSFKSIFKFKSAEGEDLQFTPPFKIIVPFNDIFDENEEVTVFTFDPITEKYSEYSRGLYKTDLDKNQLVITAYRTGNFFAAQKGSYFNRSVFSDVQTHWAKNYIESLYRKGIVKGKSKGIFGPNDHLTRAEFIKIALNSAGIPIDSIEEGQEAPFKDVPLYAWYSPYVKKAKEVGLIKGYEDGTFKPEQKINRVEAIKILFSAFDFNLSYRAEFDDENDAINKRFLDIKKIEWYHPYTEFAIKNRIMIGVPSPTNSNLRYFGPDSPMTRGEMAKIAIKTIELAEIIIEESK